MLTLWIACALGTPVAGPPATGPDAGEFVRKAVANGLLEDGVPAELAAALARDEHFVPKCEVCAPTQAALREHAKLREVPAAKPGKGVPEATLKKLASDQRSGREIGLFELVEVYVAREAVRRGLTADQRAALQKELEQMRIRASKNLGDRKGCAVCNGACRLNPKGPNELDIKP